MQKIRQYLLGGAALALLLKWKQMSNSSRQPADSKQNILKRLLIGADNYQRRHKYLGFPYAVIKKYGDDEAGYQAALITYYGFWSLFPLLLVATTVLQIILKNNTALQDRILGSLEQYFPSFGNQLQGHIHTMHRSGLLLIVGIILTLYGARGGAIALQHALNRVWQVEKVRLPGFPKNILISMAIIIFGGIGVVGAAGLSSYASALDHIWYLRFLPLLISLIILIGAFWLVFKLAVSRHISRRDLLLSAVWTAIGIEILQAVGGYLVTHELKQLSTLYGTFAIVLGLLFWIYLQAQVMLYAVEITVVRKMALWPRALVAANGLTEGDKLAYTLQAKKERFQMPEEIDVSFRPSGR